MSRLPLQKEESADGNVIFAPNKTGPQGAREQDNCLSTKAKGTHEVPNLQSKSQLAVTQ
jgi:hypothetical protein